MPADLTIHDGQHMQLCMAMTRRIHLPVSEHDEALYKAAARRPGLSLAEWARRLLAEQARRELAAGGITPAEALETLFGLEAPVDDVQAMIDESVRGRFG